MKKTCFIFAALTAIGCSVALGNSITKVAVVRNGDVFRVIYKNSVKSTVKVTILDADSNQLFAEKIVSNGEFIRPYNLANLPLGDYKICIDDESGQHVEKICNTESAAGFLDSELQVIGRNAHVLKLKGADNKFLVSIPRQDDTAAEIHIYDQQNQMIYSEKLALDADFAKVYALQNLEGATFGIAWQMSGQEKLYKIE